MRRALIAPGLRECEVTLFRAGQRSRLPVARVTHNLVHLIEPPSGAGSAARVTGDWMVSRSSAQPKFQLTVNHGQPFFFAPQCNEGGKTTTVQGPIFSLLKVISVRRAVNFRRGFFFLPMARGIFLQEYTSPNERSGACPARFLRVKWQREREAPDQSLGKSKAEAEPAC